MVRAVRSIVPANLAGESLKPCQMVRRSSEISQMYSRATAERSGPLVAEEHRAQRLGLQVVADVLGALVLATVDVGLLRHEEAPRQPTARDRPAERLAGARVAALEPPATSRTSRARSCGWGAGACGRGAGSAVLSSDMTILLSSGVRASSGIETQQGSLSHRHSMRSWVGEAAATASGARRRRSAAGRFVPSGAALSWA